MNHARRQTGLRLLGLLLTTGFLSACGAETSGEAISFKTAVQGSVNSGSSRNSFTTQAGWKVELSSAKAVMGPIYYYAGEPMSWLEPVFSLLGGTAYACPTHAQFDRGLLLGEVREQYVIDLLGQEAGSTGEIPGLAGHCRSAELHFHPPGDQALVNGGDAEAMAAMQGKALMIEGSAEKDGVKREFRAAVNIPDRGSQRVVQNILADVELQKPSAAQGEVVIQVVLDAWFDGVDFNTLTQKDADGRYVFDDDSQAQASFLQAVRNRYSYRVVWKAM